MRTLIPLALTAAFSTPALADAPEGWIDDYDAAVAIAKEQNKDLFIDITGSDWCVWCKRLKAEVFDHDAFMEGVKDDFVLVYLDFPRAPELKAKVPNPERNEEVRDSFPTFGGYPTIYLTTADGVAYAQTGYQQGGPEAYVEHVQEIRVSGKAARTAVDELLPKFDGAEGEARIEAWEACVAAYEKYGEEIAAVDLLPAIRTALTEDADNAAGRKLRAIKVLLASGAADDELFDAARELDPKNEEGLLELVVSAEYDKVRNDEAANAALEIFAALVAHGELKDAEVAQKLYFLSAYWMSNLSEDTETTKAYAQKALDYGAEGRMAEILQEILEG